MDPVTVPILNDIYRAEYEHIKELGRGGGGIVFQCKSIVNGQRFAIKVIPFCHQCEKDIFPEIRTLFQIHPNIMRCYKAWVENTVPDFVNLTEMEEMSIDCDTTPTHFLYLLLEECECNLASLLTSKKEYDVMQILKDCVNGLAYIHSKNLVHCDLSSNNIFIDFTGKAKIGDFGCVVEEGKQCPIGGLPLYKAPEIRKQTEQWNDETPLTEQVGTVAKPSDIFALALVMIELVYSIDTQAEKQRIFLRIKSGESFPPQNKVSEDLIQLLLVMLNPDPVLRSTAQTLLKSIQVFFSGDSC